MASHYQKLTKDSALDYHQSSDNELLPGWRHSYIWLYSIFTATSLGALIISFILSAETLYLARHPQTILGCDINQVMSCSAVAQSWQAEIIHFGSLSIPNSFFGIAAESVFVTVGVIGLAHVQLPHWFTIATWYGGLAAFLYAYWLGTQSLFVINALCPWCLGLLFATTIQFMVLTHASVSVQNIPSAHGRFQRLRSLLIAYYRAHLDIMINSAWIVVVIMIIVVRDGSKIF